MNAIYERWRNHLIVLRGLAEETVLSYRSKVDDFLKWHRSSVLAPGGGRGGFGSDAGQWIGKIERQDLEGYLKHLFYNRGNSNQTRLTKLVALRSFWRFLVYEGLASADITADIPRPRVPRRFIQSFTRDERLRMFAQVDMKTEKGLRDASILILLVFCGLRVGELCGLRLEDLVDDGEYITVQIPEDIGKQGGSRAIDLWKAPSLFVRQWMGLRISRGAAGSAPFAISYRKGDKPVGNPLAEKDIDRLIKGMAKASGVRKPRIHSHMLRASFGSDLRHIEGYDMPAISAAMGHKNIATTDRYLPDRRRITRKYRSLRDYWIQWEYIWTGGYHGQE